MSAYNKPFDLQSASSLLRVFIYFRRVEADREYEDATRWPEWTDHVRVTPSGFGSLPPEHPVEERLRGTPRRRVRLAGLPDRRKPLAQLGRHRLGGVAADIKVATPLRPLLGEARDDQMPPSGTVRRASSTYLFRSDTSVRK